MVLEHLMLNRGGKIVVNGKSVSVFKLDLGREMVACEGQVHSVQVRRTRVAGDHVDGLEQVHVIVGQGEGTAKLNVNAFYFWRQK